MNENKIHYWLKQIRRPICFLMVACIVFCFGFNVNAEADNISFLSYYGVDSSNESICFFRYSTARQYYQEDGYNSNNVWADNSGYVIKPYWNGDISNFVSWVTNGGNMVNSLSVSGVTYDVSNDYRIYSLFNGGPSYNNDVVFYIHNSGYVCIVNGYLVSDNPFEYIYRTGTGLASGIVNTQSNNGYYCLYLKQDAFSYHSPMVFTSLDIFCSSSDGDSGFTSFTTEDTDFDLGSSSNYNFNYLKTKNIIVDPNEEEEEVEPVVMGQYYNYAGVSAQFGPSSNTSLTVDVKLSYNEYMRLHPNEYKINVDYYCIPFITDGNHYFQAHHEFNLETITGYGHYTVSSGNSFSDTVTFNDLIWNTGNLTLRNHLLTEYRNRYAYSSSNMSDDDVFYNIFNYVYGNSGSSHYTGDDFGNGYKIGSWTLNNLLTNWITEMQAGVDIYITWVGGEPETTSGHYKMTYRTGQGTKISQNDISQNFNPPETSDPQYPAEIKDSNGNTVINGTPVSTNVFNNLNAMVEYLYHLDLGEYMTLTGNIQNNFQYMINEVSKQDSNGFWGVLKEVYDIMPDEIWTWIKAAVAAILGGAVYSWYINGVRIKKG